MKTIKIITLVLSISLLIGCQGENETAINSSTNKYEFKSIEEYQTSLPQMELSEIIANYDDFERRLSPLNYNDKQVFENLTFHNLINKNLAIHGDQKSILKFLNIQINKKHNLANIKDFFILLKSCDDFLDLSTRQSIKKDFITKNRSIIEALNWRSEEQKQNKLKELLTNSRNYDLHLRSLN